MPSADCKGWSKEKHQNRLCEGCMSQSNMLQSPWFPTSILRADLCTPLVPSSKTEWRQAGILLSPALGSPITASPLTSHLRSCQPTKTLPCLSGLSKGQEPSGTSEPLHCCAALFLVVLERSGYWKPDCPQRCSCQARCKAASDVNRVVGTR